VERSDYEEAHAMRVGEGSFQKGMLWPHWPLEYHEAALVIGSYPAQGTLVPLSDFLMWGLPKAKPYTHVDSEPVLCSRSLQVSGEAISHHESTFQGAMLLLCWLIPLGCQYLPHDLRSQ
jgi:hypothetical protein